MEDTALILQVIAGHDPKDHTSSYTSVPDYSAALQEDVKGLTIGVPRHFFFDASTGMEPETVAAVNKALAGLEELGARVEDVHIPSLEYATIANIVISLSEAFAYHKKNLQSQPQNYGEIVRTTFYVGGLLTAADYVQAQRTRSRIKREFAQVLQKVDLLVMPTRPKPAPTFEEYDPMSPLFSPSFTAPFNQTGMPAISVPCGFDSAGLPLGLQIAGKPFDEPTVLKVAYTYQQYARWYQKRPLI